MTLGIAIVTGASRGIGQAIARRLSKDGFDIALNDLSSQMPALDALHREISTSGRRAYIHPADVSQESEVKKMVNDTIQSLGGLHVVRLPTFSVPSVFRDMRFTSYRWWRTQESYVLPGQTFVITSRISLSMRTHRKCSGNCR